MKQHQNTVLWQINEKNEKKRKEILDQMEDERVRRLQELNYQMRIREEQEKGRQMVCRSLT
jgi:IS4 transposase